MAAVLQNEEEEEEVEYEMTNRNNMAIVPTTLATIESLTMPLVQEVVLLADFRCKKCQDRVADIFSRLNGEEAQSIEISMMEKKVTFTMTRRRSRVSNMSENKFERTANYKNPDERLSLIKRLLRSSSQFF